MAVYVNGKALDGTTRQPATHEKKRRVAINRAMWRGESARRGPKGGVYAPRRRRTGDLA